jgi:cysteine desulfurase
VIYLDHHASTPLSAAVGAAMADALTRPLGNPSSIHRAGRAARALVEQARLRVAAHVGATPRELVFTSGGTEALHLVVRGVGAAMAPGAVFVDPGAHPAMRAACEQLARTRGIPLHTVPAAPGGAPDLARLIERASAHAPALVALSWVQHETGAVAPVRAVADRLHACGGALVLDAVQALGKVPLDLGASGAKAAALSAHKIGGPAGVGAAWIADGAREEPQASGGAQERGVRAGTENLVGIVGFAAAAAEIPARLAAMPAIGARRDRIERALREIQGVVINGAECERVATACHASVRGAAGEEMVAAFDLEGFCVSAGPACSSGRPGASTSMRALYPEEPWRAESALRITLGPSTTDAEVDAFVAVMPGLLARVRSGG